MIKRPSFNNLLQSKWQESKFVCVGLDSDYSKLPQSIKKNNSTRSAILKFNQQIIDATFDLVLAYKAQVSFYEAVGEGGWRALKKTVQYLHQKYPNIPTILDAKRGDIGNTNLGYTKAIFDDLGFDAVTINPYLGQEALAPFLACTDKGIIILVKTSNPGAGEFQDLQVAGKPLYQIVAEHVAKKWNKNNNCCVVVGATYPKDLKKVRDIVGDMPILIPGMGVQGGEIKSTVLAGKDSHRQGMIINSSRGIIFASQNKDFAKMARTATLNLHQAINKYLKD
ncbi:orotidine-5'-phosphate decarboxylase [Candidatus Daviesbacteria bacterium]|nr:orotidine-5'-phosphate decarboxylase [Candidatus Daviesbacteria bacterium]